MARHAGWTALVLALAAPTLVAQAPGVEAEARAIDAMLIAPCCFTQQVSVHQSAAADEVRRDVRARLAAGETRQQILDAYVATYGKRILAEPPAEGFDLALYVMPFVLFLASAAAVALVIRRVSARHALAPDEVSLRAAPSDQVPDRDLDSRLNDELRDLD